MIPIKKDIRLVDHGLANSFDDRIEINKEFKKDPELYDYLLKHELSHTNEIFSLKDLRNELRFNKNILKLLFFVLKRPKLWYELLPFYKKNGVWIYDFNMMFMYLVLFILIGLNIFIFKKVF